MNLDWLLENADIPIKHILTENTRYLEQLEKNYEVQYWLSLLKPCSENND